MTAMGAWAKAALAAAIVVAATPATAKTIARWSAPEAKEGVIVDGRHFYAIDGRRVVKYEKATGRRVGEWADAAGGPIRHLTGGTVVGGRLYITHTTLPDSPVASSVEIIDAATMRHVGNHSFGIGGQANWIDRRDGHWWVCLAYYDNQKAIDPDRGTRHTQLVRMDDEWRVTGAWLLDPRLADEKLAPSSASGGAFGPDGRLYVSGSKAAELYVLSFPEAGSTMRWEATIPLEIGGQHFAWDKNRPGIVYGANPKAGEVTVSDLAASLKLPAPRR